MLLTEKNYPISRLWYLKILIKLTIFTGLVLLAATGTTELVGKLFAIFAALMIFTAILQSGVDRFSFTDDCFSIYEGSKEDFEMKVPYSSLSCVEVQRGMLDKLLKISSLGLYFYSWDHKIKIDGFKKEDAEKLKEFIEKKMKTAQRAEPAFFHAPSDYSKINQGEWEIVYERETNMFRIIWRIIYGILIIPFGLAGLVWIAFIILYILFGLFIILQKFSAYIETVTGKTMQDSVIISVFGVISLVFYLSIRFWLFSTLPRVVKASVKALLSPPLMYKGKVELRYRKLQRKTYSYYFGAEGFHWMIDQKLYKKLMIDQNIIVIFKPYPYYAQLHKVYIPRH